RGGAVAEGGDDVADPGGVEAVDRHRDLGDLERVGDIDHAREAGGRVVRDGGTRAGAVGVAGEGASGESETGGRSEDLGHVQSLPSLARSGRLERSVAEARNS